MKAYRWFVLMLVVLLVAGCAAHPNPLRTLDDLGIQLGTPAGFWLGLWHGFILPVALIGSLFRDDIGIYEVNNIGAVYDAGFVLGAILMWGGGGRAASSGKKS